MKNEDEKDYIIDCLEKIAKIYVYLANKAGRTTSEGMASMGRSRAFENAAKKLKDYTGDYSYESLKEAEVGGKSTSKRESHTIDTVIEIYNTGHSKRLDELMEQYGNDVFPITEVGKEKESVIDLFETIKFIGKSKANKLYDAGYRTLEDLKKDKKELLTYAQYIYANYYENLKKDIPREEMVEWQRVFTKLFNCRMDLKTPTKNEIRWIIAGSYRRGEAFSSDIDLLIMNEPLEDIVTKIMNTDLFLVDIKEGQHMSTLIVRLDNKHLPRQLDIIHSSSDKWIYELLHWTGSAAFTKLIQLRAHEAGFRILNEYGLFDKNDKFIPAKTEEDIFATLGLEYLEPADRTDNISHLIRINYPSEHHGRRIK